MLHIVGKQSHLCHQELDHVFHTFLNQFVYLGVVLFLQSEVLTNIRGTVGLIIFYLHMSKEGNVFTLKMFFVVFFHLLAHLHCAQFSRLVLGVNHHVEHGAQCRRDAEICGLAAFCQLGLKCYPGAAMQAQC